MNNVNTNIKSKNKNNNAHDNALFTVCDTESIYFTCKNIVSTQSNSVCRNKYKKKSILDETQICY